MLVLADVIAEVNSVSLKTMGETTLMSLCPCSGIQGILQECLGCMTEPAEP